MKKLPVLKRKCALLIVISLFTFSFSFFTPCLGQFNTYHPFPHSNAGWSESTWCGAACWGMCNTIDIVSITLFDYYARGDTVVNRKNYFKLNASGGYWFFEQPCCCTPDTIWQCYNKLYCLLREDTLARKLYASFSPNYGIKDTLLYDFNLKVGDTLPDTYISQKSNGFYVSSIDSILVGTTYRKQFIISDTGYYSGATIKTISIQTLTC